MITHQLSLKDKAAADIAEVAKHLNITTAVTPSALRKSTVTPSTPKMLVRVYIALRGSDSHEASIRLQFFLGVGRIAYQIEITGNSYYFIV